MIDVLKSLPESDIWFVNSLNAGGGEDPSSGGDDGSGSGGDETEVG